MPAKKRGEAGFRKDRLQALMDAEDGMNPNRLAKTIKASPSTVGRWFNEDRTPEQAHLAALAAHFKKPQEWFFGVEAAPSVESRMVEIVRQLDELNKGMLLGYAMRMLEDQQHGEAPVPGYVRTGHGGVVKAGRSVSGKPPTIHPGK